MDIVISKNTVRKNPFIRPWMYNNCAASGETSKSGGTLRSIVAGGMVGGLEACISYPAEFIKTQLQLDEKSGKNKQFNGFVDVIKQTVAKKGILGLYRGLSVIITFSVPKFAARFGTFEKLKSLSVDEKGNLGPSSRFLCGLGAGVSEAILAVTPMETIKVKFIHDQRSSNPKYKGLFQGIKMIIKEDGFKGIYQGATTTVIRQGSNQAVRFYVMETLKNYYRVGDPSVHVPKLVVSAFGICAGVASVLCNNPVDVVKTRMQGLEASRYRNTWDCVKQTFMNEGFTAFYKGSTPRLLRVCCDTGFSFVAYDVIIDVFKKIWP